MDWTPPTWLSYLICAGMGGLIAIVIQAYLTSRETSRAREAEYLKEQLRGVYGPLHMLASLNGLLLEHWLKVDSEYDKAFAGGDKLSMEAIQARNEQMEQTITVMNEYGARMLETNEQIVSILRENWHLLDPQDMKLPLEFLGHILRRRVEIDGKVKLPMDVLRNLPKIKFWKSELEVLARERFLAKQTRLRDLTTGCWGRWRRC